MIGSWLVMLGDGLGPQLPVSGVPRWVREPVALRALSPLRPVPSSSHQGKAPSCGTFWTKAAVTAESCKSCVLFQGGASSQHMTTPSAGSPGPQAPLALAAACPLSAPRPSPLAGAHQTDVRAAPSRQRCRRQTCACGADHPAAAERHGGCGRGGPVSGRRMGLDAEEEAHPVRPGV